MIVYTSEDFVSHIISSYVDQACFGKKIFPPSFPLSSPFFSSSPCLTITAQSPPFSPCFFLFQPLVPLFLLLPHLRSLFLSNIYTVLWSFIKIKNQKKELFSSGLTKCMTLKLVKNLHQQPKICISYRRVPAALHSHCIPGNFCGW